MHSVDFTYRDDSGLIKNSEFRKRTESFLPLLKRVASGDAVYSQSLGWHSVKEWAGDEWLQKYETLGEKVRKEADALVVVGIGGSNQAARAVYEALGGKSSTEIIWAGNTISADSIVSVLKSLESKKNVYIDVIAKNFETLEPGITFRALRDFLRLRYGSDYRKHVIVTFTENTKSWKMAKDEGYTLLPFPDDIGGRYTALSPVGLFPLAVAGIDIRAIAEGAAEAEKALKEDLTSSNPALRYASFRTEMAECGKTVELLTYFEPRFYRFAKWWKQLLGESEGKDNKGLLPMEASYSEDLHSLGQFIQDGTPMLFETFLNVGKKDASYVLRNDGVDDGFSYLDGKDFWDINRAAYEATVAAHSRRFPCIILNIDSIDEKTFGSLFYFFEFATYLSCLITGVNPFDQNGVEAYKKDMFRLLGKPENRK